MTDSLQPAEGLSTLVLTNLPAGQRKLIRLILRRVEMPYAELCETVETWPAAERLTRAELDAALQRLSEQHYIVELGGERGRHFKVSFSRRASRQLTQGLWENENPPKPPAEANPTGETT